MTEEILKCGTGEKCMRRGATPDLIIDIPDVDLSDKRVYLTIKTEGQEIEKTNEDFHIATDEYGSSIAVRLSQEDTLGMKVGYASCQIRYIDEDGDADVTTMASFKVKAVLKEGVIVYE